jgi:prepilin signal peptidase PulO-like enzyme (type II secretory pathway)
LLVDRRALEKELFWFIIIVMEIAVGVVMFVLGAVMGSFACCQAWRIHKQDRSRWSHCMKCKYRLKWYDNIPVVSWLALRGKCRKCKKPIGWTEILAEVGLGVAFVFTYYFWLSEWNSASWGWEMLKYFTMGLGLFLAMLMGMCVLFISDAKWGKLPVKYLVFCVICGLLWVVLRLWVQQWEEFSQQMPGYLGALLALPTLYYVLWRVSKGKWVGDGDWILCIPIALVLGNFMLAFLVLFLANLLGCLVMAPVMMAKKSKSRKIYFGPFLIVAFLITFFVQEYILGLL